MTAWQALHLGRCFSKAVVQAFWCAKRLHGFGSGLAIRESLAQHALEFCVACRHPGGPRIRLVGVESTWTLLQ